MTIGENDARVVLINAVSPTGEALTYEITTGGNDYTINDRGVISVMDGRTPTTGDNYRG